MGKYVIEADETAIKGISNSKSHGVDCYVYDHVSCKLTKYPSINMASYFTGIRGLSNLSKYSPINVAGYTVSKIREECVSDKHKISLTYASEKREKYHSVSYTQRSDEGYETYDYYTGKTVWHKDRDCVRDWINKHRVISTLPIESDNVNVAVSSSKKNSRTCLLRGYGVRSLLHGFEWFPYTEEVILSNMYNRKFITKCFKLKMCGKTEIVFGLPALAKILNAPHDMPFNKMSVTYLNSLLNAPHESVERLNNIVDLKIKI
jgi:hypothetical protein